MDRLRDFEHAIKQNEEKNEPALHEFRCDPPSSDGGSWASHSHHGRSEGLAHAYQITRNNLYTFFPELKKEP